MRAMALGGLPARSTKASLNAKVNYGASNPRKDGAAIPEPVV